MRLSVYLFVLQGVDRLGGEHARESVLFVMIKDAEKA
jgi:hypothetical protein